MLVSPKAESKTNRDTILKLGGSWVRNVLGVKKKRGGDYSRCVQGKGKSHSSGAS